MIKDVSAGHSTVQRETLAQPGAKRVPKVDWRTHAKWAVVDLVTWPWQARQLKSAGFVRTGWRKWEYPG